MRTYSLTPEQAQVLEEFRSFLGNPDKQVFILRGAAGSGKTLLIMEMARLLDKAHYPRKMLLAPTGRAARILCNKAHEQGLDYKATTIHRGIYAFEKIECLEADGNELETKDCRYIFPLRLLENKTCVIVDEASMISDIDSRIEYIQFGSGRLLTDLLDAVRVRDRYLENKIVFVGDPVQLPPVGSDKSLALNKDYFESLGYGVVCTILSTIQRQEEQSGILSVASQIREQFFKAFSERTGLRIEPKGDIVDCSSADIVNRYIELHPSPQIGASVVIAWSNQLCYTYNQSIRSEYFGTEQVVAPSELLLVNQNNIGYDLTNGDIIQVISVAPEVEVRQIPVKVEDVKKRVDLRFREITFRSSGEADASTKTAWILENLLISPHRDLSVEERKALYIDFCIRTKDSNIKEGTKEFLAQLQHDLYFNALRVKYGYALTCHKSQGGEWDTVFVDYSGRTGIDNDSLRWCYTATTRAKKRLYGVHLPAFSRVKPKEIGLITEIKCPTIPVCRYQDIPDGSFPTPYHKEEQHVALRMHYHKVQSQIQDSAYSIIEVRSLNYRERYTFAFGDSAKINIDFQYNKDHNFTAPQPQDQSICTATLLQLLKRETKPLVEVCYSPSTPMLEELYQRVVPAAQGVGLVLCNVEEHISSYYVLYLFKYLEEYAELQFYFTEKKGLTKLNPRSTSGTNDTALRQLLERIGSI